MARGGMNDPEIGTHAAPPPPPPPPVQRVNLSPVPILARARDAVAPPASLGGARTAASIPAPRPPSLPPSLPLSPPFDHLTRGRGLSLVRRAWVASPSPDAAALPPSVVRQQQSGARRRRTEEEKVQKGQREVQRPSTKRRRGTGRTDGRTDGRTSGRPRRHGRTDEDEGENSAVRDSGEERTNFESRTPSLRSND